MAGVKVEVFALMVDCAYFVGIGVGVCFGVGRESVEGPGAFP